MVVVLCQYAAIPVGVQLRQNIRHTSLENMRSTAADAKWISDGDHLDMNWAVFKKVTGLLNSLSPPHMLPSHACIPPMVR